MPDGGGFLRWFGSAGSAIKRAIVTGAKSIGEMLSVARRAGRPVTPVSAQREIAEARRVSAQPTSLSDLGVGDFVPFNLHQEVIPSDRLLGGNYEYEVHVYGRRLAGPRGGQFVAFDFPISSAFEMTRGEIEQAALAQYGPDGKYPRMAEVRSARLSAAFRMPGTTA